MMFAEQAISALEKAVFHDDPSQLTYAHLKFLHHQDFAGYWLADRLPEAGAETLRQRWRSYSVADMKQEFAYREIAAQFRARKIRFCPIKGADLAWRVYPVGGVRYKCDLDVLVHPEDLQRAFETLQKRGWKSPFQYKSIQHLPQMYRKDQVLEVHFHLPHWERFPDAELWRELRLLDDCEYRLPLELNLAMLFHHSRHHFWSNGLQLLMDSGYLVKAEGAPDWAKMAQLAERFQILPPALLFQAFPDFFPSAAQPPDNGASQEIRATFRRLLLTECRPKQQAAERVMCMAGRFSWPWWRARLKALDPASVRLLTGNPKGHYFRLLLGYRKILVGKVKAFWRYRHGSRDQVVVRRLADEKTVEEYLQ